MGIYFVDEYERQLDERGRIILPSKVREKMSSTVYVTQSPVDKCLQIYTEEELGLISERLRELPGTSDRSVRDFVRNFFRMAASCDVDKQGRIVLAERHIAYAGLKKNVVLVGANTKMEIWDKDTWDEYNAGISQSVIAEGISKYNLAL